MKCTHRPLLLFLAYCLFIGTNIHQTAYSKIPNSSNKLSSITTSLAIAAPGDTVVLISFADNKVSNGDVEIDLNFGDFDNMFARNKPVQWAYESYVKFQLSADIGTVQEAYLSLFSKNPKNSNFVRIAVFKTSNDWDEMTQNFLNAPGREGPEIDAVSIDNTPAYYDWNVTSLVNEQLSQGSGFVSFLLASTNTDRNYDRIRFNTKEAKRDFPMLTLVLGDSPDPDPEPEPEDCTASTINIGEDATVNNASSESDDNYGSKGYLFARNKPSGYGYKTYLKFDLTDQASADQYLLHLYGANVSNSNEVEIGIFPTSDAWDENTLTFNNSPDATGTLLSSQSINSEEKYYTFDLSQEVLTQLNGDKEVSFLVESLEADRRYSRIKFNSGESGANPPFLEGICLPQTRKRVGGIDQALSTDNITLFPNPVNATLGIDVQEIVPTNDPTEIHVALLDVMGRTVHEEAFKAARTNTQISISVGHLKNSLYFAHIYVNHKRYIKRFIVHH